MEEYKFESIYQFINIVYKSVKNEVELWGYDKEEFINSVSKFSKKSLLHIYAECTLFYYYMKYFKKNGGCIEEDYIQDWLHLFKCYNVYCKNEKYNLDDDDSAYKWFESNKECLWELFSVIANEIVHILFTNKNFLIDFNKLVVRTLEETEIPEQYLTPKKTIKRQNIPQWVKRAVFHRDKGRCVFCNKDLTGIITTLNSSNFDHILPLDKMGTNDPCNIQLSCETCNKSKGANEHTPIYKYEELW